MDAKARRHILVDYTLSKQSAKRGGGSDRLTLEENLFVTDEGRDEIVALDNPLGTLETLDR